jgi:hypothetical protein
MVSLLKMWKSRIEYTNLVRTSRGSTVVAPNAIGDWNLEISNMGSIQTHVIPRSYELLQMSVYKATTGVDNKKRV